MKNFLDRDGFNFSDIIDTETDFIPLLSQKEEENMLNEEVPDSVPLLPVKNTVLFPGVVIPISISRDKSIKLIREVYQKDKIIGVVAQKDSDVEDPDLNDLYNIGTVANIVKVLQMPDGSTTVIIQGKKRFLLEEIIQQDPYHLAKISSFEDTPKKQEIDQKFKALISNIKDLSLKIIKLSPNMPNEASFAIKNIESYSFLVNFVSSNLNIEVSEKQELLEVKDLKTRANIVLGFLTRELQVVELKNQIQSKVKGNIDKQQRDYILNQQLKTIQEELGGSPHEQQLNEFRKKADKKKWSKRVKDVFEKEYSKIKRMNPSAMEYSMQLNYLDTLIELPWDSYTSDNFDLKRAANILNKDHYGLEKIKDRILEYLAVLKLKGDMKSPILCFVGPPGVGKTSLGKSIAKAINRNYVRMSLGGLRDEAEIRGHRRTYVGAMPGRIIQNIKKAKSSNPVFVLDEVDKVGHQNFSGDPSSALLEVLDPEQNVAFHDNYLEVDYDLSKVMFIATANSLLHIHPALKDRMEIINLSGYILEEKVEIAKRHIIPKQIQEHGLKKNQITFTKRLLEKVISDYTRESGVRMLEKNIANLARYKAKSIVLKEEVDKTINLKELQKILGVPPYFRDSYSKYNVAGVVKGLAWTWGGGEVLYVEVTISKGKGELSMTGNLGDVMKESATLAYEYLKSHAHILNINPEIFEKHKVHIHVPEGATPKDGPSAGITVFTALASAFTQRKAKENVAMTGEITLRGSVLPVGGIKEKILAAKRAKIYDIILSSSNKKDVEEINPLYVKGINIHYVDQMIDLIDLALQTSKIKNSNPVLK